MDTVALKIHTKNGYDNICYCETNIDDEEKVECPNILDFWTIINPSEQVIKYYEKYDCVLRKYNNDQYLLSKKAASVLSITDKLFGVVGMIYFTTKENKKIFILSVDNKKYIQNTQGACNPDEEFVDGMIRETYEELKIVVEKEQCKYVGCWSFNEYNSIVNTYFHGISHFYHIEVKENQISHIINKIDKINEKQINVVPKNKIDCELDEVEYIILIHEDYIDDCPETLNLIKNEKIVEHSFKNHHREVLCRFLGKSKYCIDYLEIFDVPIM